MGRALLTLREIKPGHQAACHFTGKFPKSDRVSDWPSMILLY
jgi:hypothetical protein